MIMYRQWMVFMSLVIEKIIRLASKNSVKLDEKSASDF